ncbi:MAG TPA: quinone oxidoreductase [Longimicrobiaceae bacterium]|jgi:NADPH2:quinone reductase|nr:quinone oxidoreductase [Longimicrobiaceae bacterium]
MKALCFDRFGGPEVLEYRELPDPQAGPGEAIVRMRAVGLNFADVYRRKGSYHLAGQPPYVPGYEGAGVVVRVGPPPATEDADAGKMPRVGDRVGFADVPFANAELVAAPASRLIPLPDDVSFQTAAASLLQGLTAQYLTRDSHPVAPGQTVAVHAAAGGVGLLLVQIAKLLGARVIGLTSSEEKRAAALAAGAEQVALYGEEWVDAVRAFGGGTGVDVVYDSVGSTLRDSLRAVRTGGHVVFYGMAGGDPQPVDPRLLMDESKSLTGGDLWNVLTGHAERVRRSAELFGWIRDGRLHVEVSRTFPLAEGAAAHAFLESRRSIGKVLLVP